MDFELDEHKCRMIYLQENEPDEAIRGLQPEVLHGRGAAAPCRCRPLLAPG
jgi:hypothetical protein